MKQVCITTERLMVRQVGQEDVPAIVDYMRRNRQYLQPFEPVFPESYYNEAYWRERVGEPRAAFSPDGRLDLFMFAVDDCERVIGRLTFSNLVRGVFQACHLGFSIDEFEQRKGYMTEAVRGAVAWVFRECNLHRVMANYMPRNQASGEVLAKAGFTIEGEAKAYLRISGVWEDHILTSVINEAWREG